MSEMTATFLEPPSTAAWQHLGARQGFEVVFLHTSESSYRIEGATAAVEDGEAWAVEYVITLDRDWLTTSAVISGRSASGRRELKLEADRTGAWTVNGAPAPEVDGCLDVDLEASALTNAFPVHRLGLSVGQQASAPAAYVRAPDLSLERLEQHYVRRPDDAGRQSYRYTAPRFRFEADVTYDESGLVIDYPGIALRAG
jgi:uncharacterized protein